MIVVHCLVCESEDEYPDPGPGKVAQLTVEHEDDCAFLAAIEEERGDEYVKEHGYPILITVEPAARPKR